MRLILKKYLPLHRLPIRFSTFFILFLFSNPSPLRFLFVIVSVITSHFLES